MIKQFITPTMTIAITHPFITHSITHSLNSKLLPTTQFSTHPLTETPTQLNAKFTT